MRPNSTWREQFKDDIFGALTFLLKELRMLG